MKRVLFFMLLMGSMAWASAQSAIGITHQNQVYNDGDTITITLPTDAENYEGIGLKNQSNSRIEGVVMTLTPVTLGGIEIFASCTGEVCIPGLVSNPIDLAIRGSYNSYIVDFVNNYPDVTTPSVYTLTAGNNDDSTTVVLNFKFEGVGITPAGAMASLNAFPNPSDGQVSITYATTQSATLEVYDVLGRTIRSQQVTGTGIISVADLPTGVYAYGLVVDNRRTAMRKLVIK